MRFVLLLSCLILLFSCSKPKPKAEKKTSATQVNPLENNIEDSNQITCWGVGQIEFGDDLSGIEEKAGKENIAMDSLLLEGSFEGFVTKIWKDTDKEIMVVWKEKQPPFKAIKYLEISKEKSPYHFANGIGIGTSLAEIQKLNGNKPFKLYGFGWDYGGTIVDFNKGKLEGDVPCFKGVFRLVDSDLAGNELTAILGDQVISSDHPSLKKYKALLSIIRVENAE